MHILRSIYIHVYASVFVGFCQILNDNDVNYSNFIGINNNDENVDIMPYKIENCYLDEIINICLLDSKELVEGTLTGILILECELCFLLVY